VTLIVINKDTRNSWKNRLCCRGRKGSAG